MSRILICCGGTGGHLSPGIAIAQALIRRGHECCLIISKKRVDAQLVKKYPDLQFVAAPGTAFAWSPVGLFHFLWGQMRNFWFGTKLIRSFRPDIVFGFGGFVSVGMGVTGKMFGIPLVLHEANRQPGKTIRILARLSDRIYLPEGIRLRGIPLRKVREAGFPLRKEIYRIPAVEARSSLGLPPDGKLLLVLGGSQGAQALNQWVEQNQEKLASHGIHVLCLTGLGKGEARIEELPGPDRRIVQIRYEPFSDQMNEVLNSADLAIARAGAGTIAEFIACRVPSILVPYPFASDNHQLANARYLEQQGGSVTLEETHIESLYTEVSDMIFNDWFLNRLRGNLKRLNKDALKLIIQDLEIFLADREAAKLSESVAK